MNAHRAQPDRFRDHLARLHGNTNKRAGDATDLRAVRKDFAKSVEGCIFCALQPDRILAANALAVSIRDKFPVTELHCLVIPRRHVSDYFDLHDSEVRAVHRLSREVRRLIADSDTRVVGFNMGVNSGDAAGQTMASGEYCSIPFDSTMIACCWVKMAGARSR